jgi:transcriptional regulator with XRE-family HTH domain
MAVDDVGSLLRHWRRHRRMSQQALADDAEISTRHLSCLETGRARPSREMVLVLTSALDVPLRERNTLLLAAGFAPAYRETDLSSTALRPVRTALEHMLHRAEPYGAIVMDRRWDLVMSNRPFHALAGRILGRPLRIGENMLELTLRRDALGHAIQHLDEVARGLLLRLHREAVTTGDDDLFALVAHLERIDGVPKDWRRDAFLTDHPVAMTVDLQLGDQRLSLFTTLTTMGTPTDVTASELRIEHYFPADEATEAAMTAFALG